MIHLKRVKDSKSWLDGNLFFDNKGLLEFPNAFDYIDKDRSDAAAFEDINNFNSAVDLYEIELRWTKEAESALGDVFAGFKGFMGLRSSRGSAYGWYDDSFIVKNDDKSLSMFEAYAKDKLSDVDFPDDFREDASAMDYSFLMYGYTQGRGLERYFADDNFIALCIPAFAGNLLKGAERYFNSKGRKSDSRKISDWNVLDNEYLASLKKWLQSALEDVENVDLDSCRRKVDLLSCEYEDTVEVSWVKFERMTFFMNDFYDSLRKKDWKDAKLYGQEALNLLEVLA